LQHPDISYVQQVLNFILLDDKFEGWKIQDCRFDYYTRAYSVTFAGPNFPVTLKITTEKIESADSRTFKLRRLKSSLKRHLLPESDD